MATKPRSSPPEAPKSKGGRQPLAAAAIPPRRPMIQMDAANLPPSIDVLNSAAIFQRRIKFSWVRRRGSIIQAGFADGRKVQWPSANDLRTFARSQDILFDATGYLISTPTIREMRKIWEPVAQLIRQIADLDSMELDPALKDEFAQIIRSTWIRAKRPIAENADEFFEILSECQTGGRDHQADRPRRCCVWGGGDGESAAHFCWIYQEALSDWLSTPRAKSKYYPWDDVRRAFVLLDFVPRQLCRSRAGQKLSVRVWRGPLDLLVEDETGAETPI